jgi:branched-chain amino acid transport system substrate-binding protein
MGGPAANAFTATVVLAMAVDTAGGGDPAGIRSALRALAIPAIRTIMPWNGLRFDASGQNQLAAAVVEQRAGAGFQVVYPRELATAAASWRR